MSRITEADFRDMQQRMQQRTKSPVLAVLPPAKRGMNKWEAAYAVQLNLLMAAREIVSWRFESLRLRLADGAWFKPDFVVVLPTLALEIHEVKGYWREAARVRIKVAAELYPEATFFAVTKTGGEWTRERFFARDTGAQIVGGVGRASAWRAAP